jgi:type IV secretory pathway TrbF-like protein
MESDFYLQARREWDERYADLVLGKRNWQIASAGLMLLSLILALGIVWMSARTKVIPFVVEVDKLGYAITIPTALTASNTGGDGRAHEALRDRLVHPGRPIRSAATQPWNRTCPTICSRAHMNRRGPLNRRGTSFPLPVLSGTKSRLLS